MATTVFLHIGLPKTATTYLQTILWGHQEQLAEQGVLMPGPERRFHYWTSRVVREEAIFAERANKRQRGAWDTVRADVERWPGTAVISHEFFSSATADQAARMVAALAPAEVHLVVTAREPLGLFTASWQEFLKNRGQLPMAEYSTAVSEDPGDVWNWRSLDLRLVLERWAPAFPPERVHVLPTSPTAPPRQVWDRFARLVGVDPDSVDVTSGFANSSMGVAEAETLRRINAHLDAFNTSIDLGTYIRTFLADERLVPRGGEKFWPDDARIEEIRQRGRAAVDHVRERGYDVVGDLESLLVPDHPEPRRTPDSVSDAEVADVAVELAATMLHDVRDLRHQRRRLRRELAEAVARAERPTLRLALVTKWPRLRRFISVPDLWADDVSHVMAAPDTDQ